VIKKTIYCKVVRKWINPEYFIRCINRPQFDCASCKIKRNQPQRKALEKWVNTYWCSLPFRFHNKKRLTEWEKVNGEWRRSGPTRKDDAFYNGSFKEIRRKLGVRNLDERSKEQLLSYSFRFGELIDFELRTVPLKKQILHDMERLRSMKGISSPKEDERKIEIAVLESRLGNLPERERLNRPLYYYVSALAIFWERWTGKKVRRLNENKQYKTSVRFYNFVDYCLESMGLSHIWGSSSVMKAVQRLIHDFILPVRDNLKNYPSLSMGDIDPSQLLPSIYLLDSISEKTTELLISKPNLLKS